MASLCAAEAIPQKESGVLKGHEGAVLAVRFNKDGAYCLTCGRDRTLRLWNPHRMLAIKTYAGHGRDVRDVAVSSDNSKLASCGGDRHIFYWDVQTGRVIRRFPGHDSEINDVEFNSECNVLISGGYDCFVKVWDCRSFNMAPIQVLEGFRDSVTSVVITQSEIVCGSVDGTIRTFDIRMGKVVTDHLDQSVTSVGLSNDGYCILAGCLDSKLRLLDRRTGGLLNEYSGHQNKSFKLDSCLTNTDAHVISGSEDGRVCFWDLVEGNMVSSINAHSGVVCGIDYHPTECCMVTCSVDGTARLWK